MGSRLYNRRRFIKTASLSLPFAASASAQSNSAAVLNSGSDFIKVRNGRFELRGRPYTFVGTNLWYGCYLGDAALPGGRQRLHRELDRLQSIGVTNIRLLAGSETSPLAGAIPRGITRSPRNWDEGLLNGLDYCLSEMARRDMKAVLFLSNFWQWSGSFAQYVRWVTGENIPDPDKPVMAQGDWSAFMRFSARLYNLSEANDLYQGYVANLIRRRNTVNGRVYREDPTIMTWELANEPRPGTDDASEVKVQAFCKWVEGTARSIHELDSNHLVCTGSEGIVGCLRRPELFIKVHEPSSIDYVTVHMWLKNWGWLRDPKPSPQFESAVTRAKQHVEQHNMIATDTLHKPLVLEEFGLPRDHENYDPVSATAARDDYFNRMFDQVVTSCRVGRALQGANFWAWGGEGRVSKSSMGSAEALLGDPFCEPQGLNSVFDTDKSTLTMVARANKELAVLSR